MLQDSLLGLVRTALAVFGGWLVSKGYIAHDQAPEIEGAALTLVIAGFSILDKVVARQRIAQAVIKDAARNAVSQQPISKGG